MKKLLTIIPILLFTRIFPSTSYAEWTATSRTAVGDTIYLDFERIRKVDGYVYYWSLADLLKPSKWGHLSVKSYQQGDCRLFRHMHLSGSFHKEPMGEGTGDTPTIPEKHKGWIYPSPDSGDEHILKEVCAYAN